jgi:hypothetical protein
MFPVEAMPYSGPIVGANHPSFRTCDSFEASMSVTQGICGIIDLKSLTIQQAR